MRRWQRATDVTARDGSVAAALAERGEAEVNEWDRGCQVDKIGMKVGGGAEGQGLRTTDIKGPGIHETKGRAAEGGFHTDEDAVEGRWAKLSAPAVVLEHFIHRITWEFKFFAPLTMLMSHE